MVVYPATRRQILSDAQHEHHHRIRDRQCVEARQSSGHGGRTHRLAVPAHQACFQA